MPKGLTHSDIEHCQIRCHQAAAQQLFLFLTAIVCTREESCIICCPLQLHLHALAREMLLSATLILQDAMQLGKRVATLRPFELFFYSPAYPHIGALPSDLLDFT